MSVKKDYRLQANRFFVTVKNGNLQDVLLRLKETYQKKCSRCYVCEYNEKIHIYIDFVNRLKFIDNPFKHISNSTVDFTVVKAVDEKKFIQKVCKHEYVDLIDQKKQSVEYTAIEDNKSRYDKESKIDSNSGSHLDIALNTTTRAQWLFFRISNVGELKKERIQEKILDKYKESIVYMCLSKNSSLNQLFRESTLENDKQCIGLIKFTNARIAKHQREILFKLFGTEVHISKTSHENLKVLLNSIKKYQDFLECGESKILTDDRVHIDKNNVEACVFRLIQEGAEYLDLIGHDMEIVEKYVRLNRDSIQRTIYETRMLKNREIRVIDSFTASAGQIIEKGKEEEMKCLIYQLTSVLQSVNSKMASDLSHGDETIKFLN
jgi:hypothetical protein